MIQNISRRCFLVACGFATTFVTGCSKIEGFTDLLTDTDVLDIPGNQSEPSSSRPGSPFCGTWKSVAYPWPKLSEDSSEYIYLCCLQINPDGTFTHERVDIVEYETSPDFGSSWGDESRLKQFATTINGTWSSENDTRINLTLEESESNPFGCMTVSMVYDADHNYLYEDVPNRQWSETEHPLLGGSGFLSDSQELKDYSAIYTRRIVFGNPEGTYKNEYGDKLVLNHDGTATLSSDFSGETYGSWWNEGSISYLCLNYPRQDLEYELSMFGNYLYLDGNGEYDLFKLCEGEMFYEWPGEYEGSIYTQWSVDGVDFSINMDF